VELGSKVAALIGLGIAFEEGFGAGLQEPALMQRPSTASACSPKRDAWDVVAEIPNDLAAALILLEHHWAIPLGDAIAGAGGFRIADGIISPLDLVAIGEVTARRRSSCTRCRTPRPGRLPSRTAGDDQKGARDVGSDSASSPADIQARRPALPLVTDLESASRRLELAGRHGNVRPEGFTRVIELVVDETLFPLEYVRAPLVARIVGPVARRKCHA
jgi:hypothetical protein